MRENTLEKKLSKCIKFYLGEELNSDLILNLLKNYRKVVENFLFWFYFEDEKIRNWIEISDEDSFPIRSGKLSLQIIILIALIHNVMNKYNEGAVREFFSNFSIKEKFLFNWLLELKSPNQSKTDFNEKRELIENFIGGDNRQIDEKMEEKIRYLFALRSQIVHKGNYPYVSYYRVCGIKKYAKIAYVEKFPEKGIEEKVLIFDRVDIGNSFEFLVKTLFLSALLKKAGILRNEYLTSIIKYSLERISSEIQRRPRKYGLTNNQILNLDC